jgi:hypothetical protein
MVTVLGCADGGQGETQLPHRTAAAVARLAIPGSGLVDGTMQGDTLFAITADGQLVRASITGSGSDTEVVLDWSVEIGGSPLSVFVGAQGVGTWDWVAGSVRSFQADGTPISATTLPLDVEHLFPGGQRPHSPLRMHGRLVPFGHGWLVETRDYSQQLDAADTDAWIIALDAGLRPDTLHSFQAPSYSYEFRGDRRCCVRGRVYAAQPLWDVSPSGRLLFTAGARGQVVELWPRRNQVVAEWSAKGHRVTRRLEALAARAQRRSVDPDASERSLLEAEESFLLRRGEFEDFFAKRTPTVSQLMVDDLGRVWVRRYDIDKLDGLGPSWMVFSHEGAVITQYDIPLDGPVFEISGGRVLGTSSVETGATELVLLDLENGP